jgi:hypothetical protein
MPEVWYIPTRPMIEAMMSVVAILPNHLMKLDSWLLMVEGFRFGFEKALV